jgi:hypothetical protein
MQVLFGDHFLLRDSGPYVITFANAYAVITFAMVILLRDFGQYLITLMIVCLIYYFKFSCYS